MSLALKNIEPHGKKNNYLIFEALSFLLILSESLFDEDMSFNISNMALFSVYLFEQLPSILGNKDKPIYVFFCFFFF